MKKAGIVGGIGPASTVDYYRGIVERVRAQGGDYPEIVIDSVNMTEMLSLVQGGEWDALVRMLLRTIKNLANAGAELAAIASNTPHIVFDRVSEASALPLISIVEATCLHARAKGCQKIAVIGTRFTMASGLYSEAFKRHGMEAILPSPAQQEAIHNLFFPNLENGIVVPEDKQKMLAIVNQLITEHRADALCLGCTELPLMLHDGDLDTLLLNTIQIHIAAIVNAML